MNWIKPEWPVAKHIHAAVTLRSGGYSQGVFNNFNLALHVHDEANTVLRNRNALCSMLNLPNEPIWLQQVHGNKVINADIAHQLETADASFSNSPNTVCAILTADCLPILIASHNGKKIAAIHAGWKSLLSGIISNTINALDTSEVMVWFGPAIGPDCFEVGGEVREAFVDKAEIFSCGFNQKSDNKFLLNIYQLARIEFATLGITQIYGGDLCTVTDSNRFYSYRRDGETGRMASLIWRD